MIEEQNINQLPKDWKILSLVDDLPYIKTGVSVYDGKKRYYSTGSIKDDIIFPEGEYSFFDKPSRANRIAIKGDVFQARMKGTNKAILIDEKLEGQLFSTGFFQIRPLAGFLNNKYIFYYFTSSKFNQIKDKLTSGSTQLALNDEGGRKIFIPIPSFTQQEIIVSKIEELFSELDNAIKQLKAEQQQLNIYRQSVLNWAFEGKLTNKNMNEGELPEEWEIKELKSVAEKISDGPFGSNLKTADYVESGIRVIRLENIGELEFRNEHKTYISNSKYESLKNHTVTKGDIIFSSFVSENIRVAVLPDYIDKAVNKADCFLVRTAESKINRKYLVYYFSTRGVYNQLVKEIHGATRPRINTTQLKAVLIPTPSILEQNKIVQEIESRLSVADKMEESINQSLQQSEALKQSILKKAFEGKLIKEKEEYKPRSVYFYQTQTLGYISYYSGTHNIEHGEMTIAKYAYLLDKIYNIPTHYTYDRWHLGPYPPEMKKVVNNKEFFNYNNGKLEVADTEQLFKYNYSNKEKVASAIDDLANIFGAYSKKERSHKTELLATVCKVIEDIQLTDLLLIRQSMKDWKIELANSVYKNKAEKFSEEETKKCVEFIIGKGWDKKLIKTI